MSSLQRDRAPDLPAYRITCDGCCRTVTQPLCHHGQPFLPVLNPILHTVISTPYPSAQSFSMMLGPPALHPHLALQNHTDGRKPRASRPRSPCPASFAPCRSSTLPEYLSGSCPSPYRAAL